LGGRKAPCMETAEMMDLLVLRLLHQRSLEVLQKTAKGTAALSEHLKDGFIIHDLVGSHVITFATKTPHHTPTKPRNKLKTTYNAAMRNAPVCKFENVSHSKVENVLYAPTKPTGTRNLQAGFNSLRLPRNASEKPIMIQAVILMTNVP